MGNTAALPYDVSDPVEFKNYVGWHMNKGSQKEGAKQNVSIFKFAKAGKADKLPLAQRNVQKLRTIRHPYILTYVDTLDTEESLILVTEYCVPLQKWLADQDLESETARQSLSYELTWGFKGILKALDFLHSNCSLVHGYVGKHAIFVTQNGDWKLGSLELAANCSLAEDQQLLVSHNALLEARYLAPERVGLEHADSTKREIALQSKLPPYYLDIFSFGTTLQQVFNDAGAELSGSLAKYVTTTINSDMKKRPTAGKLLQAAVFNSDFIKILESVQEFAIKGQKEVLESIKELDPLLPQMTMPICSYKVLPSVCKVIQISINDFQNRDAREACRQAIVVCVDLLSKLAALKKIDEQVFQQDCLTVLTQLWTMTDRTIRTSLLSALKHMADLIPSAVVNKTMFDSMLAGFSDSNSKLRESTLTSLIYVVNKLDETQLQDRLVRCIVNLQNDPEASIRTNATIFLGKIAAKLKEAVRARVLCSALAKAMKDNFVHCRVAALRTALACVKMMDIPQLATKIIPQTSILLLDKSFEVRELSLHLMDASLARMRQFHEQMTIAAKEAKDAKEEEKRAASTSQASSSGGAGSSSSSILASPVLDSWTAWSIQGLSRTLDADTTDTSRRIGELSINRQSSSGQIKPEDRPESVSSTSMLGAEGGSSTPQSMRIARKAVAATNDTDDWDDGSQHFFDARTYPGNEPPRKNSVGSASEGVAAGGGGAGWDDDDLDSALRFDEADESESWDDNNNSNRGKQSDDVPRTPPSRALSSTHSSSTSIAGLSSTAGTGLRATSSTASIEAAAKPTSQKAAKPPKVAVKKLDVSKDDGWDDF